MLVTTHYLDEAEHCHRVAIIHAGRLAAIGTTAELKRVFEDRTIVEVQAANPVEAMRLLDAHAGDREDERLRHGGSRGAPRRRGATATPLARAVGSRRPAWPSPSTAVVQPSLEDVFLDVVEQRETGSG